MVKKYVVTCVSGRSIFGIIYNFEMSVIVNKKENYDGKGP